VGGWERIDISLFMLWIVVLATALLRARETVVMTGRRDANDLRPSMSSPSQLAVETRRLE
jgi:hypothetical protein